MNGRINSRLGSSRTEPEKVGLVLAAKASSDLGNPCLQDASSHMHITGVHFKYGEHTETSQAFRFSGRSGIDWSTQPGSFY